LVEVTTLWTEGHLQGEMDTHKLLYIRIIPLVVSLD